MAVLGHYQAEEPGLVPNVMITSITSARVLNLLVGSLTAGLNSSWRCSDRGEFCLTSWSDGVVVFNEADGHLQCLSPAYGQVFELLVSGKVWTTHNLTKELITESPATDDLELMENALDALASSNLIIRVPA